MKLNCIHPKLARDEVLKLFQSRWRQFKLGRFLFETAFYLPYYLFRVEVQNAGQTSPQLLAIDAMTGELDLYRFASVPAAAELLEVETTQVGQTALTEEAAFALLQEKVRRGVYGQGFFRVRDLRLTGQLQQLCYLPYWVGLYERKEQISLQVVDAVRGQFEGAKMRAVVLDWLRGEAARRGTDSPTKHQRDSEHTRHTRKNLAG